MKRLLIFAPLLLAASLTFACNGDDDEDPTPTATTGAPSPTAAAATPTEEPAASPTQPSATSTPSGAPFGSDPVTIDPVPDPPAEAALLQDVRVGAHPDEDGGFDRIVFEFEDAVPPGEVGYVDDAAQCGSGEPVDPEGEAILEVRFTGTNAHNEQGQATIDATEISGPGTSILESLQTCDFEAVVTWDIGTPSEQPFRVSVLSDPPRVVVDVQH